LETTELYKALEEQYFGDDMQEKDEIECLPELLKGVTLFVDVGASLGQYSFFANRVLKGGRIFCIEADPLRMQRLKKAASEWEAMSTNQITVLHAAAAEKEGKVEFFTTDANVSGGLFVHGWGGTGDRNLVQWKNFEVECITLDSLFKNLKPDLVKIDVEGAEHRVLEGARSILEEGKCRFLVEVHPWGDKSVNRAPSDVFRLFSQFGYDFRRTHRHWLFEKSNHRFKTLLKCKLICVVMEHAWLKSVLKRAVLASHVWKRKLFGTRISRAGSVG
jgi:FkbM family methyltransferase